MTLPRAAPPAHQAHSTPRRIKRSALTATRARIQVVLVQRPANSVLPTRILTRVAHFAPIALVTQSLLLVLHSSLTVSARKDTRDPMADTARPASLAPTSLAPGRARAFPVAVALTARAVPRPRARPAKVAPLVNICLAAVAPPPARVLTVPRGRRLCARPTHIFSTAVPVTVAPAAPAPHASPASSATAARASARDRVEPAPRVRSSRPRARSRARLARPAPQANIMLAHVMR